MNINTAFYANWAQFWPGGPTGNGGSVNSPSSWGSFANDLDRIIYGYLLFGIKPNPNLGCFQGISVASPSCMYANPFSSTPDDPFIDSGDWGTYMMYPNTCFTGGDIPSWEHWIPGLDSCSGSGRITDPDCFKELHTLKANSPRGLKIIMSYGGWTWTHGGASFSDLSQYKFSQMVNNSAAIKEFVNASYKFIHTDNGFDGVDFDWEYPGELSCGDFQGFHDMIVAYRQLDPNFIITMQCSGFLSSDINCPGMSSNEEYFTWLGTLLDAGLTNINIMAYDYYTAYSTPHATRPNTPLTCTKSSNANPLLKTASGHTATHVSYNNIKELRADVAYKNTSYHEIPKCSSCAPTTTSSYTTSLSSTDGPPCATSQYQVVKDDNASKIAQDHNTTLEALYFFNPQIQDWQNIQIGQIITLPPDLTQCQISTADGHITYLVKPGDGISNIADKYGISTTDLCTYNGYSGPGIACQDIQPNQLLQIPNNAPPYNACKRTYTTQPNDTLLLIAFIYGVTVADICSLNKISPCGDGSQPLPPGTQLNIPTPPAYSCSGNPCYQTYTTLGSDTITSVAQKLGISVKDLCTYNFLSDGCTVPTGTLLQIPSFVAGCDPCHRIHEVQSGEKIADIVKMYSLPSSVDLCAFNNLTPTACANLTPGTMIKIPTSPSYTSCPATKCHTTYKVQGGDSISGIAKSFGITAAQLCTYNWFDPSCSSIQGGQTLQIPSTTGGCDPCNRTYTTTDATETLTTVSTLYGIPSSALQQFCTLNNMPTCDGTKALPVGTMLKIPTSPTFACNPCQKSYVVQPPDTIDSIAEMFNISPNTLCSWNGLSDCTHLVIGSTLWIPPGDPGKCDTPKGVTQISVAGIDGRSYTDLANFWKFGTAGNAQADALAQINGDKSATDALSSSRIYQICGETYIAKKDDTIESIANEYANGNVDDLCAYNSLFLSCSVVEGQQIYVPAPGWSTCNLAPPQPIQPIDLSITKTLDQMKSVLPPEKMAKFILGLALYGRTYAGVTWLKDKNPDQIDIYNESVGQPAIGPAPPGPYTNQSGVLSYYEISRFSFGDSGWPKLETGDAKVQNPTGYNCKFGTSVAYNQDALFWVAYDAPDSISTKIQTARNYGLAGVMSFTPQQDDFVSGWPIMSRIASCLRGGDPSCIYNNPCPDDSDDNTLTLNGANEMKATYNGNSQPKAKKGCGCNNAHKNKNTNTMKTTKPKNGYPPTKTRPNKSESARKTTKGNAPKTTKPKQDCGCSGCNKGGCNNGKCGSSKNDGCGCGGSKNGGCSCGGPKNDGCSGCGCGGHK